MPLPKNAIYVPIVRQAYDYSCGAASLASCLYYWGAWDGREPELYDLLDTTCEGTGGEGMIKGAMHYGLQVTTRSGLNCDDLRGYLLEGYTCILSIQSWGNYDESTDMSKVWDDGHYVVLVGFEGQDVYLMDPAVAGAYRKMTIRELLDCWHDYADDGGEDWNAAIILRGETPSPAVRPVRVE